MLNYIKGVITETMPGMVTIENNGIGYGVYVPENSSAYLTDENQVILLYTVMLVREDDVSLYGFTDKGSLTMFRQLLSVSGVGAKAAMAVLSALPLQELKQAIAYEDVDSITKANGVGKKTAMRIVLELKDKVGTADIAGMGGIRDVAVVQGSAREEAVSALMALGYTKTEAMSAMVGLTEEGLTAEEYIRLALRQNK